ncbi:hypothetical protein [Kribbella sp. NBC_00889]|uniref:hypothetical protein n=1 Tax=Kribbella sp. NBC_00889 TaxID=2975974 RepID=UPI00386E73FF|nr:hypothetical protein OG817_40395 [Kribbella sp. NBC_00889]
MTSSSLAAITPHHQHLEPGETAYGDQLIGVRKRGARQWLLASPDAFVWLRLYQLDRGTPGGGQPVWLTLREPHRPPAATD